MQPTYEQLKADLHSALDERDRLADAVRGWEEVDRLNRDAWRRTIEKLRDLEDRIARAQDALGPPGKLPGRSWAECEDAVERARDALGPWES